MVRAEEGNGRKEEMTDKILPDDLTDELTDLIIRMLAIVTMIILERIRTTNPTAILRTLLSLILPKSINSYTKGLDKPQI
jgi:hypothetical protein